MRYDQLDSDTTHFLYNSRLYINDDDPRDFETDQKIELQPDTIIQECPESLKLLLEKMQNTMLLMAIGEIDAEEGVTKILKLTYKIGYLMGGWNT